MVRQEVCLLARANYIALAQLFWSMSDYYLALIVSGTAVVIVWLVTHAVEKYFAQKMTLARQRTAAARQAKAAGTQRTTEKRAEIAEWVKDLLEQVGHSEEELYEDEPPDDLSALLESPIAKSFLDGLAKGKPPESEPTPTSGWF